MDLAGGLDRALQRAGIPIVGVSIGNAADRGSWRVLYAAIATDQQRRDGAAILASYDPATDAAAATEDADRALDDQKMLKAFAIWTAGRLGVSAAVMRNQVLAIYKGL